jgi:hypothetical protein
MALTDLKNIPKVMRKQGWLYAAMLMETWFSRPAKVAPVYTDPVTNIISMNYALGFSRARDKYDALVAEHYWIDDEARDTIASKLYRKGLLTPGGLKAPKAFGDLSKPATELYDDHAAYMNVSYGTNYLVVPVLDSMVASLGRFAFWLNAAGTVGPVTGLLAPYNSVTFQVTIQEVAIYIRDSYDFNGDQRLGYWSDDDVSLGDFSMSKVTNETFRDWRTQNHMGGDFLIYSDVIRTTLNPAPTFNVYADGTAQHFTVPAPYSSGRIGGR